MSENTGNGIRVTKQGLVLNISAIVGIAIFGYHQVDARFAKIEADSKALEAKIEARNEMLEKIDRRLERIEVKLGDRWSESDMRLWAAMLAQKNQRVDVPVPEHRPERAQ